MDPETKKLKVKDRILYITEVHHRFDEYIVVAVLLIISTRFVVNPERVSYVFLTKPVGVNEN